ncbi:MAG TPA: tetratricopeptide repeat protein [Vicinamibacterales bacterium]|nr:hypothetical protein [Acidobacteriota bacterium]HJO18415.1 tetratricopeptide repeat protein [Vicinamibacterales bacterium]
MRLWVATVVDADRLQLRAKEGDAKSQTSLGDCYLWGLGVTQDLPEAVRWYRKLAAQGHAEGQGMLGWCYQWGLGVTKDLSEAVRLYQLAAEQGLAQAQYSLGRMYGNGEGVSLIAHLRPRNLRSRSDPLR